MAHWWFGLQSAPTRSPRRRPWGRSVTVLAALSITGGAAGTSSAAVDLTGDWYVVIGSTSPVFGHITQTGTMLSFGGSSSGTIDPMTGVFMVTFPPVSPPTDCGGTIDAQADASGNTFIGTARGYYTPENCVSFSCVCSGYQDREIRGSRAPCGNGTVDAGEACDNGNFGRNADCCRLDCTLHPDGASCDDGLFCNGLETTCQSGVCQTGTAPCALSCDESADQCVTACPNTPQSCRAPAKSLLLAKKGSSADKDTLVWKWKKGAQTTRAELADPTNSTEYALCVFAGTPATLVGDAVIPASATLWSSVSDRGYAYIDSAPTASGIKKMLLKGGVSGKAGIRVMGKGVGLPIPPLPATALRSSTTVPLTVQLINGDTGLCWGSDFDATQVSTNDGEHLKARSP